MYDDKSVQSQSSYATLYLKTTSSLNTWLLAHKRYILNFIMSNSCGLKHMGQSFGSYKASILHEINTDINTALWLSWPSYTHLCRYKYTAIRLLFFFLFTTGNFKTWYLHNLKELSKTGLGPIREHLNLKV